MLLHVLLHLHIYVLSNNSHNTLFGVGNILTFTAEEVKTGGG